MNRGRSWHLGYKVWAFFVLGLLLASWFFWSWRYELWSLCQRLLQIFDERESVRRYVLSLGFLAPFAFIALQALQVIVSPVPGEATGFVGGFLFGEWLGLFYSIVGLTLGSMAAFLISRQFRHLVRSWLLRSPSYARFEHLAEHQGLFVFFILFLFPGFPKDFLCYFLGLSRMPWQAFLAIVVLGRIPGTLVLTLQGANIYSGNMVGFFSVLIISVLVLVPSWYYRERIYQWIEVHSLKDMG